MTLHVAFTDLEPLVSRINGLLKSNTKTVIAIAGVPGAGKSTLVEKLIEALKQQQIVAKALPQDGYHYYRSELAKFDDPPEAFRRRGAPFTFNVDRFLDSIKNVRGGIKVPLFDHRLKDPVEDDITIGPETQVVFVEGNYVGLKDDPWCQIADYTDELWVVATPLEIVHDRIVQRHLASGVANSLEEAVERAEGSDWQNALYVMANTRDADVVVENGVVDV